MLKNYVINVPTNTARQAHIQQEFGKQHIAFEFFPAITPEKNNDIAHKLGLNLQNCLSSPNEIACLLSHVSLWQLCIDESLDYIGIYEDDIFLGENFVSVMAGEPFFQDQSIDILKLEKTSPRAYLTNPTTFTDTTRTLYQLESRHLGGAGYLLSRQACGYLLGYLRQLPQLEALDVILFDVKKYPKTLPVYQLEPAIVIQEHHLLPNITLTSSLNQARGREIKVRLSGWQKAKREILRVFRPLYMRQINFK